MNKCEMCPAQATVKRRYAQIGTSNKVSLALCKPCDKELDWR